MENAPDTLHPLLTVTALAVTVAALATIGVITGVIPERAPPVASSSGAAAATFATRLAADPLGLGPTLYSPQPVVRACEDCATVETLQRLPGDNLQTADRWEARIRMDDGTTLTVATEGQPSWHAGERVRLVDGTVMSI